MRSLCTYFCLKTKRLEKCLVALGYRSQIGWEVEVEEIILIIIFFFLVFKNDTVVIDIVSFKCVKFR